MNQIEAKQVVSAIEVLQDLNNSYNQTDKKKLLLDDSKDGPVFLSVSLKKIPSKKFKKDIKINLPHCFFSEKSDICLITGDADKNDRKAEIEPDVQKMKLLLSEKGVNNVSEVVTLRQLRTEYREFSTKSQLVNAHDVFLCDKVIAQCLPKLLGKAFFKRNKFPQQVDLKVKNLKEQIDKKLSTIIFPLNCSGNSCSARVARLGMQVSDIADNILDALKVISVSIPGGWDNVKGVHVKLQKSPSIPIFQSLDSASDVIIPKPKDKTEVVSGELSTKEDQRVKVHKDGSVAVVKISATNSKKRKIRRLRKILKLKKKKDELKNEKLKKNNVDKLNKKKMNSRKRIKMGEENEEQSCVAVEKETIEEKLASKINKKKSKNVEKLGKISKVDSEKEMTDIGKNEIKKQKNVKNDEKKKGLKRKRQDSETTEKKKSAKNDKEQQDKMKNKTGSETAKERKKNKIPKKHKKAAFLKHGKRKNVF